MATSSIIENIRIDNQKALEAYVEAMEYRVKKTEVNHTCSGVVSDPQKVKEFMDKALAKKGIVL